jgi:hypothetical protein
MGSSVENGMKASGHQQFQGRRRMGEVGRVVLQRREAPGALVIRPVFRLSWTEGQAEQEGGQSRVEVPRWAYFAGAKRAQFAALSEGAVLAGLREAVSGMTCLASLRSMTPRLTAAGLVPARSEGFSPGRGARVAQLLESAHNHDADEVVDEGGIYSW